MFEPIEWMQMLATLDVCTTETTPTKFVDEDGHDVTPFFMLTVNMTNPHETENNNNQIGKVVNDTHLISDIPILKVQDEISI